LIRFEVHGVIVRAFKIATVDSGVPISVLLLAILFLISPVLSFQVAAQQFTGAVLDPQAYAKVPKGPPLSRGAYASVPPRMSLKAFAPTPGNQGSQGSCVGWASAYAARTLAEARRFKVGDRKAINQTSFSPAFVYNQIRVAGCGDGSLPWRALDLMTEIGVPLLKDFPYTDSDCSREPQQRDLERASHYKIKGYQRLFSSQSQAKHVGARRALANGNPAVIGMMVSENFMRSKGVYESTADDLEELRAGTLGGHAMAVIGYDDTKFGGAFELINSWGADWGDGGFVWVTYDDFNTFVLEGYEMIPPDPPRPPMEVDMGGELRFRHISGKPMDGLLDSDGAGFQLKESYPSGTRFRLEIDARHGSYVYALGGDLAGKFVELFPRDRGVSPHVDGGGVLLIPGPNEDYYTRMNEQTGTDFLVVLFSREPFDAGAIARTMSEAAGDVRQKLAKALGERSVEPEHVEFAGDRIGFTATSDGRVLVPIIVAIEHVAPSDDMRDRDPPKLVIAEPAVDELEQVTLADPVRRITAPVFRLRGTAQDQGSIQEVRVVGSNSSKFSSRGPFEAEVAVPADGKVHPIMITAVDAAGNRAETTIRVKVAP